MKEVFISYSSIDYASAQTVRNVLEKNGLSCWMAPEDIPGGSNYTKEIPIAIRNCSVFVLILSKNAQNSTWVLKELDSAVNCGKVILPFMIENCSLNDEFNFLLTGAQRYSAYQKTAEAMETLVARIRSIIGMDTAPANVKTTEPVCTDCEEVVIEKPEVSCTDKTVCSACGADNVIPLPRRIKRSSVFELCTMLFIPALAIIGLTLFFFVGIFILFDFAFLLALIGAVGGGIWGNYISKTIVRRHRIRRHLPSVCYRCKTCGKVFLGEK